MPFDVVNELIGWRYSLQILHRLLLHNTIPGVGGVLVMVFELNLALVEKDVTFGGCLRAKTGFEFANLSCVIWSLKFLNSKEIVFITFLLFMFGWNVVTRGITSFLHGLGAGPCNFARWDACFIRFLG